MKSVWTTCREMDRGDRGGLRGRPRMPALIDGTPKANRRFAPVTRSRRMVGSLVATTFAKIGHDRGGRYCRRVLSSVHMGGYKEFWDGLKRIRSEHEARIRGERRAHPRHRLWLSWVRLIDGPYPKKRSCVLLARRPRCTVSPFVLHGFIRTALVFDLLPSLSCGLGVIALLAMCSIPSYPGAVSRVCHLVIHGATED